MQRRLRTWRARELEKELQRLWPSFPAFHAEKLEGQSGKRQPRSHRGCGLARLESLDSKPGCTGHESVLLSRLLGASVSLYVKGQ